MPRNWKIQGGAALPVKILAKRYGRRLDKKIVGGAAMPVYIVNQRGQS